MKEITFPLEPGMQGTDVVNLQDALLFFLERSIILPENESFRKDLFNLLKGGDRAEQIYGDNTIETVKQFQHERELENTNGNVDQKTANKLNDILREMGMLEQNTVKSTFFVSGKVTYDNDLPFKEELVQAFHEFERGTIRLGKDITDGEGRYTIRYEPLPGIASINLCVEAYEDDGTKLQSSEIIRGAAPIEIVDLNIPVASKPSEQRRLEGRIVFPNGQPAENLNLRLYRIDFGGVETKLNETSTREFGLYTLPFDLENRAAVLEIRVVMNEESNEKPLSKRISSFGNEARIIVNLVAPAELQSLATEYERLVADLTPHVENMKVLAEARENADRQDITVLNRATGWDAKLIALAADTEKLSQDQDIQLSQEAVYGLFRAGLPRDKMQLAQVNPEFVKEALETVHKAGIVKLTDNPVEEIKEIKAKFENFSNNVRLKVKAPGSRSNYEEFIKSGLSDEEAQTKFATAFFKRSKGTDLWQSAREAGLNDMQIQKMQLQGKLAFLTGNSMEMTSELQDEISDPEKLAENDYYLASKWETKIRTEAGVRLDVPIEGLTEDEKQKLQALIPHSYAAEKIEDNLKAYAEDMARKVRLSYPTQVIGRMIEQDVDDKFKLGDERSRSDTAMLLKNAAAKGFRLGETSIEIFIKANSDLLNLNEISDIKTAMQHVKTLQRVYQITPSSESMPTLMKLGLTSAYDISNLSKEEFVNLFVRESPSRKEAKSEAELIYRKARQVNSVTYNIFTAPKKLESTPQVFSVTAPITDSLSSSRNVSEEIKEGLIKQFPTMESLFGSMDFCDCEHCRSVLSPAAYLVDLLQFIDPEQKDWENFLIRWKSKHNNQDYFAKYKKPYDVLIGRRPDIPYISLTCENTNTVLPYIDIVNEILEYYVANEKLTEDAVHDTGNATSEELLAEPQSVIAEAYDKLQQARYPLNLPFDLWIETVRNFCNYFEVPLPHLLEVFRPGNELFAATQPYDRESIFIESLGLSPAEYAIFTDPNPLETDPNSLKNDKWYELYGYTPVRPIIGDPKNIENATLTVSDADAANFSKGDLCTYFDISKGALYTEIKEIKEIDGPSSGGPGQTTITFVGIWKTDDNTPDHHAPDAGDLLVFDAPKTLESAKTLSRRLGVTYKELVEIVQTGFVNPELVKLALLHKLGVTIQDVIFYRDKKEELEHLNEIRAFEEKLESLTEKYPSSGIDFKNWLNNQIENNAFNNILVLADPNASCNFDKTTLRYASGKPADSIALVKINLFVRLWRKLGWTIEETDRALQAFIPENASFNEDIAHLKKQPLRTALIYLAHFKNLNEQLSIGKSGRLKLITLWSDLPASGKESLYSQLFLTRGMLKSGEVFDDVAKMYISVFDDPLGQYLTETGLAAMAKRIRYEVSLGNVKSADKIDPTVFADHPKLSVKYDDLREVQSLAYQGTLDDTDKAQLAALSSSEILKQLLDAVQIKAKEFTLIKGHMLTLQGALGLTADEITQILTDAGMSIDTANPCGEKETLSIDTAKLCLKNISLLYRYRLLAKALKLSTQELIMLKQLSGLNPFKPLNLDPLNPDQPNSLSEDSPFSETLRFIEIADHVNKSGQKIEDLGYLLRHQFDKTGKYRPKTDANLVLIKTLADGIRAIQTLHAVPKKPGEMDEAILRQKLGLALPSDVIDKFLAVLNGKIEYTVTETGVSPENKLNPETFKDEPSIREVSYNGKDGASVQKLVFKGMWSRLPQEEIERIKALSASPVFPKLLENVERQEAQLKLFLGDHLKKQKLSFNREAGFLEGSDLDKLFEPSKLLLKILPEDTGQQIEEKLKENEKIAQENQAKFQERRYCVAKAFLPFLQQRLIRQFITETLTAQTGADPGLVETLLSDARLLGDSQPLLEAFKATSRQGVNVTFFDADGKQLDPNLFADVDTSLKGEDGKNKPDGTNRTLFEGYLEVPTSGTYSFHAALNKTGTKANLWLIDKADAETELSFDSLKRMYNPLLEGTAGEGGGEIGDLPDDKSPELKSGVPYRFVLEVENLNDGEAQLLVQGETLPKNTLSQLTLYSQDAVNLADRALVLLNKALQLIQSFGFSEREVRYLLTHPDDFDNLSLSKLPTVDEQIELETIARKEREADLNLSQDEASKRALLTLSNRSRELFKHFLRLLGYARLKSDLAGNNDDLIGIFETSKPDNDSAPDKAYPLIAKLTRREELTVKAVTRALFVSPSFKNELHLQQVWDALKVIERFGVPVESVLGWTRIVSKTVTPEQRFFIARDLKETIKARFDPDTWYKIAQPTFDKLRQKQRDALVVYVIHQHRFARMEQLYEYFLIDPGMEPVVQTSRIRLAISSLQLFIQRCLINLEKDVPPSVINSKQWEWMKRYRVWEVNRKIFLFPENWLEPEFRDDKTHLFSELESSLLQGDVSNDLVEDAFLNYLKKLDELARLDIIAMHLEDNPDPGLRTLHVVGRTYSQPYKYFYRRYAHEMWTPWEPVTAEIEGDHLAPVVWRDRLYLFWVTFMEKPEKPATSSLFYKEELATKADDFSFTDLSKQRVTPKKGPTGPSEPKLVGMTLSHIKEGVMASAGKKTIEAQLHWSEYLQGKWSTRESGGLNVPSPISTPGVLYFNSNEVFIHVSKEPPSEKGEERGVYVNLQGGGFNSAFYLAGRNSTPIKANYSSKPANKYSPSVVQATRYSHNGAFKVNLKRLITTEDNQTPVEKPEETLEILGKCSYYTLLPCNNDIDIGNQEITSLMKPLFYQDYNYTLFIEPNVEEQTIDEWKEWVPSAPKSGPEWVPTDKWKDYVQSVIISPEPILVDPGDPVWNLPLERESLEDLQLGQDWLANPATGLRFDEAIIGSTGRIELAVSPSAKVTEAIFEGSVPVTVVSVNEIAVDNTAVTLKHDALKYAGLTHTEGRLNVIGNSGLNSTIMQNLEVISNFNLGAGRINRRFIER